jgi:hypothetical protein
MHTRVVEKLIRSKILFFDSNPIGRIFTRFSKDMAVLDLILPMISGMATLTIFRTIAVSITLMALYPVYHCDRFYCHFDDAHSTQESNYGTEGMLEDGFALQRANPFDVCTDHQRPGVDSNLLSDLAF